MAVKFGYSRLINGSALLLAYRLVGAVLTYGAHVAIARWLGPASLGIYVEIFAWCIIASIICQAGMGSAAMRFITQYLSQENFAAVHGYIRRSLQIMWATSLALCVCLALVLLLFDYSPAGINRTSILIGLATVPFLTWLRLHSRVAHAFSWFDLSYVPMSVLRPVLFLAALFVVWKLQWLENVSDVLWIQLWCIILPAIGLELCIRRRISRAIAPATTPKYETRLWLRTGMPLILLTVFDQFYPELNIAINALFMGESEVAIFNAAIRVSMLIAFGLIAIDAFNMPDVMRSHAKEDLGRMESTLRHAARLKFFASLIVFIVIIFAAPSILGMFGREFLQGFWPLMILAGGQVIRAAIGPVGQLVGFTGHHRACLIVYTVGLVVLFLLHGFLTPYFGIAGGACAAILTITATDLWLRQIIVTRVRVNPSIFGSAMIA